MSKRVTFTLDEDIVEKMPENMMIDDVVLNQAIHHYLLTDHQQKSTQTPTTQMKSLEDEKRALEIDYECLKQQNKQLESRIDDLVKLYPSASVLLGKGPTKGQIKKIMSKKMFKKNK